MSVGICQKMVRLAVGARFVIRDLTLTFKTHRSKHGETSSDVVAKFRIRSDEPHRTNIETTKNYTAKFKLNKLGRNYLWAMPCGGGASIRVGRRTVHIARNLHHGLILCGAKLF